MSFSLKKLGSSVASVVSGIERQVNPFDNGATYSNPTPAPQRPAPAPIASPQQVMMGSQRPIQFGNNPLAMAPNPPAPLPNRPVIPAQPLQNQLQAIQNRAKQPQLDVGKALGNELLNNPLTNVPYSLVRTDIVNPARELGAQNPQQAAQLQKQSANQDFFGQYEQPLGNTLSGALYGPTATNKIHVSSVKEGQTIANAYGNTPQAQSLGDLVSAYTENKDLNDYLGQVGLNQNSSGSTKAKLIAGNILQAAAPTQLILGGKPGVLKPETGATAQAVVDNIKPLNEAGSIGKNVGGEVPKPKVTLNQPNLNAGAFSKEDRAYLNTLSNEEKANLPQDTQMKLAELENKSPTQLNAPEVNTARNPFKAAIPEVKRGDYAQVISNEIAASNPVQFAGERWKSTMKKLSPEEQTNFWRAVEKPDGNYSPKLKTAIQAWRQVDDRIHGTSQALGGNTNYLNNHNLHPWNLPPEFTDHVVNGGDPTKFPGLNNLSRKYSTIAEGEAKGLKLGTDPVGEGSNYINASAALLKRRAIVKGLGEADAHMEKKTHAFDIGGGNSIPISNEARKAVRGLVRSPASDNAVIKGARTANAGVKSSILSLGQFHPINIAALRAAPTLLMKGHPIRAAVGLTKTFRVLGPGGSRVVEKTLQKALTDGMVDKAAKIGMPYGAGGFDAEGSFLKGGIGHHTVFDKQMPMMHDQVVRSIVHDLERNHIPLDSPEARAAGKAGNNLMGFVNSEAQKIPPKINRSLGDFLLAKQFTHSKFSQLRTATTTGGVAGSYARANVVANVAATTALITGLGYLGKQKSDDVKDLLLRALVDPAAPTSSKDGKGNTIKLRTPGTDTSDIAKLLGIKLVRNSDGHLGLSWNPGNMPSTIEDYARARLSPFLSSGVKLATNTTYAGKPLYDPNAAGGTKAQQAGTSIVTGMLPIGAQGIPMVNGVEKHLPTGVQQVLDAQKPGTNPLVKSIGSSFGVTPTTDTTTGKGLQSTQYFSALDAAKSGLNSHEQAVLELYAGSKKNPVTGKYDVAPNVNDARSKASSLLDQPKVIDKLINMNQTLADKGQAVDPLWQQGKDNIVKYLQYQNMEPGGASKTDWYNKNQDWYGPLVDQRNAFFGSLPPGDPNKPKLDLQYPQASPQVETLMTQYSSLTNPASKGAFLDAHPDVLKQWSDQADYTNKLRDALGYSPLKNYPEASTQLQSFMDKYNAADTSTRKAIRNANPRQYQGMIGYFDSLDLYNIGKQASVSQLQGEPDYTSKEAKSISSLARDIYQNPDGSYSVVPAGWMQGLSNNSSGSGGSKTYTKKYYPKKIYSANKKYYQRPKVSLHKATLRGAEAFGADSTKPKVSITKSKV